MRKVGFAHRLRLAAVTGFLVMGAAPAALAAAAPADYTPPYGPFGFTTMGLGKSATYGEPSLAIAPDGSHVIVSTPGGGGVNYWYSADGGNAWKTTKTTYGGGDSALDFLPDGTALSADLNFPGVTKQRTPDSGVTVSKDFGAHWGPVKPAGMEQDRQWFAHSPDGKVLYLAYHDFLAEGEFISKSTDGGLTWTTLPQDQIFVNSVNQGAAMPIAAGGHAGTQSSLLDQGVNTYSGPMLVDPNGKDLYVVYSISDFTSNIDPTTGVPPFGPVRALVVAHSSDGAATWSNVYADVPEGSPPNESAEGTMFPWGMIDSAGTVYVVFNSTRGGAPGDHFHQYYVYSKDHGATWSTPNRIDAMDVKTGKGAMAMSTGAAAAPGVIDVAWYQTDNGSPSDDNSTWTPHFAQVTGADTSSPRVVEQAVTTLPNHKGGICLQGILCGNAPGSADRSLADFFQVRINPVTHMALIAYSDNSRLGKSATGGVQGEVVVAAQTLAPAAAPPPVPVTVDTPLPPTLAEPAGMRPLGLLLLGGAILVAGLRRRVRTSSRSAEA